MPRREIAIAAAVGAVAGAIIGAVVAVTVRNGGSVGPLSEWFQAVGTVAAFGAALLLYRHEVMVRREDQLERDAEQARQLTMLVDGGTSGTIRDPKTGALNRPFNIEIGGTLYNGSDALVSSCTISLLLGDEVFHEEGAGVVGPGAQGRVRCVVTWTDDEEPGRRRSACTFADRHKRRWRLTSDGDLERLPSL